MNTYGLKFSAAVIRMTRYGEKSLQSAAPTEEFWNAWRSNKEQMKRDGFSVGKFRDAWTVTLWSDPISREERKEARAMSSASVAADIEIPVPAGLSYLPYQTSGINFMMRREASLCADEMGLGKTIQAIGVANVTKPQWILVICPLIAWLNWQDEIAKWQTLGLPIHQLRNGKSVWKPAAGWTVTTYETASKHPLASIDWDLVIVDESHYLKNSKAQRTQAIFGGGQKKLPQIRAKRRILLTGTPILNRPSELFSQIHYLDPARWPSFYSYATRYCGAFKDRWGFQMGTPQHLDELQARLRESCMIRRLKADVLTELPAKRWQVIKIEAGDEYTKQLIAREKAAHESQEISDARTAMLRADAEGDELAYRDAVKRLRAAQVFAFSETSKIRHEVGVAKIGNAIAHLEGMVDEDPERKVLVLAHHHDVVDRLVEALKPYGVVVVTGQTPADDRQVAIKSFQTDPQVRFFVGSILAMGVSATLTASANVVFVEQDWTPGKMRQAEDRCHRIGQLESLLIQHIVIDGSMDAYMAQTQVGKQEYIDQALDNPTTVDVQGTQIEVVPVSDEEKARQTKQDARRKAREELAATLTPAQIAAIHEALRELAAMDSDHARVENSVGFNKLDTEFGCELADKPYLSPRQAAIGMNMVRKYRKQYDMALYVRIFGQEWE